MDVIPPGSKMASKVLTIIHYAELGKPYEFLKKEVSTPQGEEMTQRVKEREKKRMALL